MSLSVVQIQQAYLAFFNRPADTEGLRFWLGFPGDQTALLNTFAASPEYLEVYRGLSPERVVDTVYQNLFGRAAEAEGLQFWAGELASGRVEIGNVAYAILRGAQGSDTKVIDNKTLAATGFTEALDLPEEQEAYARSGEKGGGDLCKAWLSAVDADPASLAAALAGLPPLIDSLCDAVSGIDIVFDYSCDRSGFFDDPLRRELLEQAAAVFEQRIQDDLLAETYAKISFLDPSSMEKVIERTQVYIPEGQIVVYVGAGELAGQSLAESAMGGLRPSSNDRGQATPFGDKAVDVAPWGGSISFDFDQDWYFDRNLATSDDIRGYDFYSVAAHELAHILGIGQTASWWNQIEGDYFVGAAARAVYGAEVPLSGSQQDDHWASGVFGMLPGTNERQAAAMTTNIALNVRKFMTDLDFAALSDLGWEIEPVSASVTASLLVGVAELPDLMPLA